MSIFSNIVTTLGYNAMINPFKTLRSFRYAFAGMASLFANENNARVHFLAALVVLIAGFFWKISLMEWGLAALAIGGVWAAEAFNTALEKLCDMIHPQPDHRIKIIKDLAAAGVLMMALAAIFVGFVIFGSRIFSLFL